MAFVLNSDPTFSIMKAKPRSLNSAKEAVEGALYISVQRALKMQDCVQKTEGTIQGLVANF